MRHKEFLFDFSMKQILLLIDRRAKRNARTSKGGTSKSRLHPEAKTGNLADMFALKRLMG